MTHLSTLLLALLVGMLVVAIEQARSMLLLGVDKLPYLSVTLPHDMRWSDRHMTYSVASFAVSTTLTPHEMIPADSATLRTDHSRRVCMSVSITNPANAFPLDRRDFRGGAPLDFFVRFPAEAPSRIGLGKLPDALLVFFQFSETTYFSSREPNDGGGRACWLRKF